MIHDGASCCWRHWVGLPVREGVRHPYYKFQEQWIDEFFKYDYFWMEKPPKVGATEIYLHLFMHQAVVNPAWNNGQVAIVVGTSGMNESENMISRCKSALKGLPLDEGYNTRKEFTINSVKFRAFPADNIDAARSQPNMRAFLIDEGGFFRQIDQSQVRSAGEHYIMGAKVKLVWVSTAGAVPQGAFYDIGLEPDVSQKGVYRKYIVDYEQALIPHPESNTTLYFLEDLEKAKSLPTWGRNFLHIWGAGTGDVFDIEALKKCSAESYDVKITDGYSLLSVDPAFGSSNSGILGCVRIKGIVYITEAYEIEHPTDMGLALHVYDKAKQYNRTVVDGHWSGVIRGLEERRINVTGIDYSTHLLNMIQRSDEKVREMKVKIHPKFTKLLEQLRSAQKEKNGSGKVNKKIMNFDLGDAFIQAIHTLFDERGAGVVMNE